MKRQIYCDVDGVLVDFIRPSLRIHNRHDLLANLPSGYDYWGPTMGLTSEQFWQPIRAAGPEWWATLPKLPWCDALIAFLNVADPNWKIATKPSDPLSSHGRHEWIEKHAPGHDYHLTSFKADLAKPGRLLIDDSEANCEQWRAGGGDTILVPACTNYLRAVPHVFTYIAARVERLGYAQLNDQ